MTENKRAVAPSCPGSTAGNPDNSLTSKGRRPWLKCWVISSVLWCAPSFPDRCLPKVEVFMKLNDLIERIRNECRSQYPLLWVLRDDIS
jgi:hypothetical protein